MKREILFRGKTLDGMWLLGCGGFMDQTGRTVLVKNMPIKGIDVNRLIDFEIEPGTLGQYVGLKDKNGIKVFEGDIIRFCEDKLMYVTASNDFCGWIGKIDFYPCRHLFVDNSRFIEIVGNIWDNPDLVKHVKEENDA